MGKVRRAGGGGPTKKQGKSKHKSKRRPRRDLEDLYHSVLQKEALEKNNKLNRKQSSKKQNENKELIKQDLNIKDNMMDIQSTTYPISQSNSLATLLGLIHADKASEISQQQASVDDELISVNFSSDDDDEEDGNVFMAKPNFITTPSATVEVSSVENHTKDSSKLAEIDQSTINEEHPFDDLMGDCPKDFDDDDTIHIEDASENLTFSEPSSNMLSFTSFNKPLPESVMCVDSTEHVTFHPPGFTPYVVSHMSNFFRNVKQYVDELPESILHLNGNHALELKELSDTIDQKIWNNWTQRIVPKLENEYSYWLQQIHIKQDIKPHSMSYLNNLQMSTFFRLMSHYIDICYTDQDITNSCIVQSLTILHIVCHMHATRRLLHSNNMTLKSCLNNLPPCSNNHNSERKKKKKPNGPSSISVSQNSLSGSRSLLVPSTVNTEFDISGDDRFRDQGYCQPRVLILASTKRIAKKMISEFLDLYPNIKQVRNRKRFEEEFSPEDTSTPLERDADESGEILLEQGKPPDFAELFRGNSNDQFRIGIRLHPTGATLYAPFYHSDIIVASPLGLKLIIGTKDSTDRDYDFLSSIEILVIDRSDVLKMQNWENVKDIFQVLNQTPKQWRADCDIRRLRHTYSEGLAQKFRQTILLSNGRRPEFNSLFLNKNQLTLTNRLCNNFRGMVQLYTRSDGMIVNRGALLVAKQLFMSVPCKSVQRIHEDLLSFINDNFPLPFLSIGEADKILLVVPTYVEYLRVRRILKTCKNIMSDPRDLIRFRACHEYSSNAMLTKSRQMFHSGEVKLMITTERFLFYRRYKIRGADHIVFYTLPEYPAIYLECLSSVNNPSTAVSLALFTQFHSLNCEHYAGASQTKKLMDFPPSVPKVFVLGSQQSNYTL